MDNAALAERLEAFAALLDLNGSGHYTVRAYRRAAELIRATPRRVAPLVRTGRVRELAGIGPGIETRLRELVETGRIAELDELEAQALPELVGVAAAARALDEADAASSGTRSGSGRCAELREAAAAGGSRACPGSGRRRRRGSPRALAGARDREAEPRNDC